MEKIRPRLILTIILLALVFVFAVQNIEIVEVEFLMWGFSLPRSLLIFSVLAIGVIVGWFLRGAIRITRA